MKMMMMMTTTTDLAILSLPVLLIPLHRLLFWLSTVPFRQNLVKEEI
jgi:hypothetical protein